MSRISLAGLSSPTVLAAASVVKGFVLPIEKLPATDCDAVAPITLERIEMASETVKSEKKQRRALAQARRDSLVGRHVAGAKSKKSYMICTGSILLGEEVTLVGKPRFDHFFACEGDPTIYGIEYGPLYLSVCLDGVEQKVKFDTIVRFEDNQRECRSVRMNPRQSFQLQEQAAKELGFSFRVIDKTWRHEHSQRIANWRRALADHRGCNRISLSHYKGFVTQYLNTHRQASLGELLAQYSKENRKAALAAIIELLVSRFLYSDLDHCTWSLHSKITLRGDQS